MRRLVTTAFLSGMALFACHAQQAGEAISYYLPKTVVHINLLIEKTSYKPGQLAGYARRYMKLDNVKTDAETTYRIVGAEMYSTSEPDSTKLFTLNIDKRHYIAKVDRSEKGVLLAINAEGYHKQTIPTFTPSRPQPLLNPKDFMSQDILSATSSAKMAELTANEIFEIRESRTMLARGEADFMPKDAGQLKLMMEQLNTQEKALLQVFAGTTTKDTTMTTVTFIPDNATDKHTLFRFSKHYGVVDADDLSGTPYYIKVSKKQTIEENAPADDEKKDKNDIGLRINIPAKMDIIISDGFGNTLAKQEYPAPQFGKTESLGGELFGRKQSSKLVLDSNTGAILSIEALPLEK